MIVNFYNNFYGMGGQPVGETMGFKVLARLGAGLVPDQMQAERVDGYNPLAVIDAIGSKEKIIETCINLQVETTAFLNKLVRFESLSSYEGPAMEWLYGQFKDITDVCEKVPVTEDIVNDGAIF